MSFCYFPLVVGALIISFLIFTFSFSLSCVASLGIRVMFPLVMLEATKSVFQCAL